MLLITIVSDEEMLNYYKRQKYIGKFNDDEQNK